MQSFHDDELAALDRIHSAEEAKEAYRWAREAGFERINLDLIYGLQDQTMERWQATLEQAIALAPEHLSLYALTVEEGTKLAHDIERGRAPAPDGDMQAEMYEWSCERLARGGLRALRDLELVPSRRGVPAQPGLLAQRRVAGARAGGAFAPERKSEIGKWEIGRWCPLRGCVFAEAVH